MLQDANRGSMTWQSDILLFMDGKPISFGKNTKEEGNRNSLYEYGCQAR